MAVNMERGFLRVWLLWVWLLLFISGYAQQPVFRNYTANDGLPSSEIYSVIQDKKGYMWFGTDRGLVKFDGYTFRTFTTADGLADNTVFYLYEDNKERIWYQPYSSGMGYILHDTPFAYRYNSVVRSFLKGEFIYGMVIGDNSNLWLCDRFNRADKADILHVKPDGSQETVPTSGTRDMYISSDGNHTVNGGNIRAGTVRVVSVETRKVLYTLPRMNGSGIFSCKKNGLQCFYSEAEIFLFKNGVCIKTQVVKDQIITVCFDSHDNLLVGYLYKGVEVYDAKADYKNCDRWLQNNSVTSIACDREGGLWLATLEHGVYYLSPGFSYAYTVADGLPQPKVMRIGHVNNDVLLMSMIGNAAITDEKRGKITAAFPVRNFATDIQQNKQTNKVYVMGDKRIRVPYKNTVRFSNDRNMTIGKEFVWSYGVSNLIKYDNKGQVLRDTALVADRIKCLFLKRENDLLIGTTEGLYEFIEGDMLVPLKERYALLKARIADIQQLDSTHIAIATIGQGLLIINNYDFAHPLQFTAKDGLPSMMCNVLLPDSGSLWVGTNKGLCKFDHIFDSADRRIYVADSRTGLTSNEINDIKIIGSNIWIATMNGVSVLPCSSFKKSHTSIPLYLERVLVNGKPVNMQGNASFDYRPNNINISFTALSYEYAGQLLYRYRLKGMDDWSVTTNRNVIYNNLPPGNYVFELSVSGPDQYESTITRQFAFTIRRPFWSKWWFITLCVIGSLSVIYIMVYLRIKTVQKNAAIKNDLNRFRERALRSQMNPHFLYNSMHSIQNFIRKNDSQQSIDLLAKFSLLMRFIFNNSGVDIIPIEQDLEALSLYVEMEGIRFPGKFTFHTHIDQALHINTFVPPFLIQPFVENAILHGFSTKGQPGNVWLDIVQEQDRIKITIKDDGVGRAKALEIRKRKEKYMSPADRKDSAISITSARITQVWGKNAFAGVFKIIDLYDAERMPCGTLVQFYLPLTYDKSYTG